MYGHFEDFLVGAIQNRGEESQKEAALYILVVIINIEQRPLVTIEISGSALVT